MTTPTDAVVAFFLAVDRRDWPAVRAAMTDPVRADYTSLAGGEPEELAADVLVDRWRALLPGFDVTQHHLGPLGAVATDGPSETTLACTVRGHHRIDDREWMVAGSYDLRLVRDAATWRVTGITLHVSHVTGDTALPAEAGTRAAAQLSS
jgi:hypothetical protein